MRQAEVDLEASRWLAERDARTPSSDEESAFNRWIQADIRHRVTYLRLEAAFRRCDRLTELKPLDRGIDPELLRPRRLRVRWPLAMAASLVLALVAAGTWLVQSQLGWQQHETLVGGFSRIVLEDGSVIDLNTDSEIRVRLRAQHREVRLERGEARFQVAHDPARTFTVSAADASVRAVGTAFSVRLRNAEHVEVLVAEGAVAIDSSRVAHTPPLNAGEAAVLLPDRLSVSRVEPQMLERRMAWTTGKLQFRGEALDQAVAEFNRYNRRQLKLADASLAPLRVGGTFNATDPESFAAALASTFRLRVDSANPDAIVLKPP